MPDFHILIYYYEFTCCIENNVDPDQLASELLQKPADLGLHCFQQSIYIWFHFVLRVNT